jgi:hypothetical protein
MSLEVFNPKPEDRAEVLGEEGKEVQTEQKKERILTPREQKRIDEFKTGKLAGTNTKEELKNLVLETQRGSLEEEEVYKKMKMLKQQEGEDKRKRAGEMIKKDEEIERGLKTLLGDRKATQILDKELKKIVSKTEDVDVLKELIISGIKHGEQERIVRERIKEIKESEK